MKKVNFPKILLAVFFVVLLISILGAFFDPVSLFGIYYFGLIASPVSIIISVIWKLLNRDRKDKYFIIVLIVNIILFILSLYSTLHLFDNFMSLS